MKKILAYFGNSHASYIHARGKLSTNKMVELLESHENEKILEIGFGTGATLIQMAAQSKANFFGYEASPIMYQKALERIEFCKISNRINVILLEKKHCFPAPDNTFDRVYAESIIAIQEGTDLKSLLFEIKRVLKPNGILLFNETIWLKTTDRKQAEQINERCKKSFGIIQSNHEYLHLEDWKNLLMEIGFRVELELPVSEIQAVNQKVSKPILYSKAYTLIGKMKAYLLPSMRKKWKNYLREIGSIMNNSEKLMEGIIIKAYNN